MNIKTIAKNLLPQGVQRRLRILMHGRFYVLQQETDGLLSPAQYERIYEEVKPAPDMDWVEIGGAAGTASVAVCWALKERRKQGRLVIVEKCEGGSRASYGGKTENLARLERNLIRYGVADFTRLFPHYMTFQNGAEVVKLVQTRQIAGLLIDADGWLHRDFYFLWERLVPGGTIIVDDYQENRDPKHDLTFHLLNRLRDWGLFEEQFRLDATVFGRKPSGGDIGKLDLAECEAIVERICRKWGVQFEKSGIVPGTRTHLP